MEGGNKGEGQKEGWKKKEYLRNEGRRKGEAHERGEG